MIAGAPLPDRRNARGPPAHAGHGSGGGRELEPDMLTLERAGEPCEQWAISAARAIVRGRGGLVLPGPLLDDCPGAGARRVGGVVAFHAPAGEGAGRLRQ